MQHQPSGYLHANQADSSKKTNIILTISVVVILALIVILIITQTGTKTSQALILESYESISRGTVQYGDTLFLDSNGYVFFNLAKGSYDAIYTLDDCENPSLSYTTTYQDQSLTFDPLKEKVIVDSTGKLYTTGLTPQEQTDALIKEEVYVVEAGSAREVISEAGTLSFSADGRTKIAFNAKCDDAKVTLKIYEA